MSVDDSAFLESARHLLGDDGVLSAAASSAQFGQATSGVSRRLAGAVFPTTQEQVIALVGFARAHGTKLYPVSSGKNWGYGCATPVAQNCVLVSLSKMNAITHFDEELGTVTVQPGVTQRQLFNYLAERSAAFMVPTTGAGPECSIVGNALERGYGLTPIADHFAAMTQLEAVLADGSTYRSPLSEMGGGEVSRLFKWGIGPYFDGVFTQSSLGIVTSATFCLARRPEVVEGFFFWVDRDEQLEQAVEAVRSVLRDAPSVVSGINLLNTRRMLSMMVPYPAELTSPGVVLANGVVSSLAKRHKISSWTGTGGLYGTPAMVAAARATIRKALAPCVRRLLFVSEARQRQLSRLVSMVPFGLADRFKPVLATVGGALAILRGEPSELALPLAYWRGGNKPSGGQGLDPNRDGCGVLWFAPLVPMRPASVRKLVTLAESVCARHGIEPLITLTSLSERCFDSTVPILFDRADADSAGRALACQDELLDAGLALGFVPYRVGTHHMQWLGKQGASAVELEAKIKRALDPQAILAPGRYGRTSAGDSHV